MRVLIGIAIVVGFLVLFVVFVLAETSTVVEPGTIGLVVVRGRATGRAMAPGRYFLRPVRQMTIQMYPSRELSLLAGGTHQSNPDVDFVEQPVTIHLQDRSIGTVSYTVRCQLILEKVQHVHNSYGPEGIWAVLRDESRRCVIAEANSSGLVAGEVLGSGFGQLETRIASALSEALAEAGFELKMFTVREIDLGETGEAVQATARAAADLEREQALAAVRRARVENDADLVASVEGVDRAQLLRYREIEVWQDLVQRWDGRSVIPSAVAGQQIASAAWEAALEQPAAPEAEPAAGVEQ